MPLMKLSRKSIAGDLTAGATTALVTIPDGMASAILAGINPIHGLYALMVGTPVAALTTSSQFMYVANTGALAVAVGDVLVGVPEVQVGATLVVLTIMVGLFQLLLGLFRLGGITRYISNAVLTGFMTGIAINIILGQLPEFTGYHSDYSNRVMKTADMILHPRGIDGTTLFIGLLTIALIVLFRRTRLEKFSMVLGMMLSSLIVAIFNIEGVELIEDIAEIPSSFPQPVLPDLSLIPGLLSGAVAVGLIGLVQAAGVSRSVPNADGQFPDASRDFAGQGIANTAAGFFQGMPIGGTMSETAVNISSGARSRLANILSGAFIILIVLLLGGLIEQVAMPAIAALLIVAGVEAIKMGDIEDVRDTGPGPRIIMIVTFLATLILPIQEAVLLGVVLSLIHYVYRASVDINVVEVVPEVDGILRERPAPAQVPSGKVTILRIYGSMFFASAYLLEEALPSALGSESAVVNINLRGLGSVGSTFIKVMERYGQQLASHGGKLVLSGVSQRVYEQLHLTETTETIADEDIYLAGEILGQTMTQSLEASRTWLEAHLQEPDRFD